MPDVDDRRSLLLWICGVLATVAILAAATIAMWPTEADKARADGARLGAAVADLYDADSTEEVDEALDEVHDAAADTREHAGDAISDQVADQADALVRAADGFVGTYTSDDAFETDLYQAELKDAVDDLGDNTESFRLQGSDVQQAFWNGYQEGVQA
jgi:hypothetical protein